MAVLASLQLEVFVLVISMGLWIKVLTETAIAHISSHTTAYKALYIGTMIVSLFFFLVYDYHSTIQFFLSLVV